MSNEKLNEVLSDRAFVNSLLELETMEEVQAALKEKGLDLSAEELAFVRNRFTKMASGKELSDEDLENVAGGYSGYPGEAPPAEGVLMRPDGGTYNGPRDDDHSMYGNIDMSGLVYDDGSSRRRRRRR